MNTLNRTFGRLVREKRTALRLSQAELARQLKWPQTTVSRVEQGLRGVTVPELIRMAQAFQCPAADLLGALDRPGEKPAAARASPGAISPFSAAFPAACADEDAALAQLARYGVKILGGTRRPALFALPLEEAILGALRFASDSRVFEALPAIILKHASGLDWSKLASGSYALQLQNRLGMVVAAALSLKGSATGLGAEPWTALQSAHDALIRVRLDHEEIVGQRPKTEEALALLKNRTPAWLASWHGLGAIDREALLSYLAGNQGRNI